MYVHICACVCYVKHHYWSLLACCHVTMTRLNQKDAFRLVSLLLWRKEKSSLLKLSMNFLCCAYCNPTKRCYQNACSPAKLFNYREKLTPSLFLLTDAIFIPYTVLSACNPDPCMGPSEMCMLAPDNAGQGFQCTCIDGYTRETVAAPCTMGEEFEKWGKATTISSNCPVTYNFFA